MPEDTAKPTPDKTGPGWKEQWKLIEENMRLHGRLNELEEKLAQLDPETEDPALRKVRATIVRELTKLVPKAVAEAKAGKPALLRLITRTVRLR